MIHGLNIYTEAFLDVVGYMLDGSRSLQTQRAQCKIETFQQYHERRYCSPISHQRATSTIANAPVHVYNNPSPRPTTT